MEGQSREAQDAFALPSHQRASPRSGGRVPTEIAPYESSSVRTATQGRKCARVVSSTKGRARHGAEGLAKLKPVFARQGQR